MKKLYALMSGLAVVTFAAPVLANPFTCDAKATKAYFRGFCDYVAAEKTNCEVIFIGGYYMRSLVAGYEILGDKRYLEAAIGYADELLKKQSPRGDWQTGYGHVIYLADTGSALGLFITLYDHVDKERQRQYFAAVQRYVDAIERDGLIRPSGALDVGFKSIGNNNPTNVIGQDYTISSALTGGEIYTWMYHMTRQEKYREVAYRSLSWVLSTMRGDGVIPYIYPGGKSDPSKQGDPKNDHMLWTNSLYLTSAYVGEGLLSFDRYCGKTGWKKELREKIKPHIDFVLRHQNADGTWSWRGPWDQKRSPGIINSLTWYYRYVEKDRRIPEAVRKWNAFILVPANAKSFGLLSAGAVPPPKEQNSYDCVTSLAGRALADIIRPGVDAKW